MWIPAGKLIVALVWAFWMIAVDSTAEGNPADNVILEPKEIREEYNPTYGMTLARVTERGVVLCGTKEDFPGFSEMIWTDEHGQRWVGFDVDICRSVAAAVFDDADAVEFIEVDGKTRFSYLIDGTIDVLSAATTYTFSRNVLKKLEFLPTTFYDGWRKRKVNPKQGRLVRFPSDTTHSTNVPFKYEKRIVLNIVFEPRTVK